MSRVGLVAISRFRWRGRFETSRHHLVRSLATHYDTVYLEPSPNLGRLAQGLADRGLLKEELAPPRSSEGVRVLRRSVPQMPLEAFASAPRLYERLRFRQGVALGRYVRRTAGFGDEVVLFNSHYPLRAGGLVAGLMPRVVVYHCSDEISELTQTATAAARAAASAAERAAAAAADLVLATSEPLAAKLREVSASVHFLPNGVDVATFAPALSPGDDPEDLPPSPRMVFVGNLEHGRQEVADADLLEALARAQPAWSLIFIGLASRSTAVWRRLQALENVYFLGLRPRAHLASYLRAADVCLIPYVTTALTRSIYPLKVNEYLAAGRPVVTTAFSPSLDAFRDVVDVVPADAFVDAVAHAVTGRLGSDEAAIRRRVAVAQANSWDERGRRLFELVEEARRAVAARR